MTDALVKKHGWVRDDSLRLRDLAVSAFRGTNVTEGAFAGFLAAIEANKVPKGSVLIATVGSERLYEKKPGAGAQMVATELLFILSRAHEESATKSGRVRDSWKHRRSRAAEEPMTGRCPEWLRLTEKVLVEIPDAADAARLIYKLSLEGTGIRRVTQTLTERGVRPFGRSARWNMSCVPERDAPRGCRRPAAAPRALSPGTPTCPPGLARHRVRRPEPRRLPAEGRRRAAARCARTTGRRRPAPGP